MAGLYIHIPFCESKCSYCDFFSRPGGDASLFKRYAEALEAEFQSRRGECGELFSTVYFGGGTPSIMPRGIMDQLFGVFPAKNIQEYTLEANPEHITDSFMDWICRDTPVDRLSVGVQSFSDGELRFVGRNHTSAQALDAIDRIVGSRIENYTFDLIYGLPGQTIKSWEENLSRMLAIRPPHLSAYMLSWEEGTRLNAMRLAGKAAPLPDELLAEMYTVLCDAARSAGYRHYEISNFALPGYEAVHNSNYWLGKPYLGIGASAHSYDGRVRRFNPLSIKEYLTGDAPATEEPDLTARHNETLLTALRTSAGLDLVRFRAEFGDSASDRLLDLARLFEPQGWLTATPTRIAMTEPGWLLTDIVLVNLFAD